MKKLKENIKQLIFIDVALWLLSTILIGLGAAFVNTLNPIVLNVIFSLGFIFIFFAILLLIFLAFKLNKKEKREQEIMERKYISKHKNNVATLLRTLKYENEVLQIPNAKSIYTYLEGNGKYNIEVYIADKRLFITFYESYVEYYSVTLKEYFPKESDIVKKQISQKMSLKEIEDYINKIIAEVVYED